MYEGNFIYVTTFAFARKFYTSWIRVQQGMQSGAAQRKWMYDYFKRLSTKRKCGASDADAMPIAYDVVKTDRIFPKKILFKFILMMMG